MWIEYIPEAGYTFRTRWGRSFTPESGTPPKAAAIELGTETGPRKQTGRMVKMAFTAMAMMAIIMLTAVPFTVNKPEQDHFVTLEIQQIPLGAMIHATNTEEALPQDPDASEGGTK
jgi:hypothetical protein